MSFASMHPLLLSASLAALATSLAVAAGNAQSSTPIELPSITVTSPSPITRHRAEPVRRPVQAPRTRETRAARTSQTEPTPPAPAIAPVGVLPIVTDQFATVTVVPNEDIRRNGGGSLGDLLFSRPGITGSSFAPGAASRPIIRGLDGNRVGIVENGVSSGGVSELGEDHFVPVDPLASNQIEVIRGPAALRYGSTSIGGVVSSSNNRIPEALPPCATEPVRTYGVGRGAPLGSVGCMNAETRTAISSVDRGFESGVLLDAGGGNYAIHADAYGRKTGDYNVPSYPYLTDPSRPFNGRQANSRTQSSGASIGGSYVFDGGFIGAAITQNNALYGIPGVETSQTRTRIDAQQTKVTLKGEFHIHSAAIEAVRFWAGATDYKHSEKGLESASDLSSDAIHQTFTNKEQEARVEVQLATFNARFAAITTAFGVQAGRQELTASSPEDPFSPYNGLFNPNQNNRVAGYVFNELQFTPTTKAQIAGRIEHVRLQGSMLDFPGDFLPDGSPAIATNRNPSFTPKSGSVGLLQDLPGNLVASVTAQYVERAPKPAELFSRGGHDATATFDIGNPNLRIETAQTVEAGLRRATGPLRFEATAYYTRFTNFIYRRLTGVLCGEDFDSCGDGNPDNTARQAVYSQRNAIFRGGEFQSQFDVGAWRGGVWGVENQFDVVRATFTDGTNVPRIPPVRAGGGLFWRDANWLMRVNYLRAFAQNNIAETGETPTAGYNLLKAEVSYRTKLDPNVYGARELLVGLVGNNLLNENIRSATSYTKDEVLMPGLNVRAFANLKF